MENKIGYRDFEENQDYVEKFRLAFQKLIKSLLSPTNRGFENYVLNKEQAILREDPLFLEKLIEELENYSRVNNNLANYSYEKIKSMNSLIQRAKFGFKILKREFIKLEEGDF